MAKIGKTIIFAVNKEHAKFIARRFDHHYPQYKGEFARVIIAWRILCADAD